MDCYSNPCFFVEDEFGKSVIKQQGSGIRQGCPFSPYYLFVLVMSVIDHDLSCGLNPRTMSSRFGGVDFDRVYYAADTVLVSTTHKLPIFFYTK